MTGSRPLVFLDIDGVLHDRKARDLIRFADDPEGLATELGVSVITSYGRRLAIPDYMPSLIQRLTTSCEVWWCTTWMERANDGIAAHLGIEALPVVGAGTRGTSIAWKESHVRSLAIPAVATGRVVAWIEDFNGRFPNIEGLQYIDTAAKGLLDEEMLTGLL